jgi:voltage-gated potassium channel
VIISVFLLLSEFDGHLNIQGQFFEKIVINLFIIEYGLRLWICSDNHQLIIEYVQKISYLKIAFRWLELIKLIIYKKLCYLWSIPAIIDLLAILPNYHPFTFSQIFLVFRLFKLFRYSSSIKLFADVLNNKRFELITLGIFMGFLVFIASIAIYLFENVRSGGQVNNLYDAFYWAIVTVSTVGYGDITPRSIGGRLVSVLLILIGLGVLSFFTSIIVSAFNEKMHILRENRIYSELEHYKKFIIICGYGRVGQEVVKQLHLHKHSFVIIDKDESHIQLAKRHNLLAIHDDASNNEVLTNAGINRRASAILCITGNDVTNVYITLSSRYLNPKIKIISRANSHDNVKKLQQAGADYIIEPFEIAGLLVAEYVGQPVAAEAILGILREQKQILMDTLVIIEGCFLEGMKIKEIDFESRQLILIGVISSSIVHHRKHHNRYQVAKQHFYFNPEKNFECQKNDILLVLGNDLSINYLRQQIKQSGAKLGLTT